MFYLNFRFALDKDEDAHAYGHSFSVIKLALQNYTRKSAYAKTHRNPKKSPCAHCVKKAESLNLVAQFVNPPSLAARKVLAFPSMTDEQKTNLKLMASLEVQPNGDKLKQFLTSDKFPEALNCFVCHQEFEVYLTKEKATLKSEIEQLKTEKTNENGEIEKLKAEKIQYLKEKQELKDEIEQLKIDKMTI